MDYEKGCVETDEDNLNITIVADTEDGVSARHRAVNSMVDYANEDLTLAAEKQQEMEDCFLGEKAGDFCKADDVMFVVYMGLNGFEATVQFLNFLRINYPQACIITLTCDCNINYKEAATRMLQKTNVVNASFVTGDCGGAVVMREMINDLIEVWSNKS
ncbi:MAG: hypothetical protein ACKUBY_03120 [Candidatus Moraniibacteriota bacterium]